MTSIVIGASGQVGALLYQYSAKKGTCIGTYCNDSQAGLHQLDLRDHARVRRLVQELRPDVCYVPGGMTFVDYAENHSQECREINVLGTTNLAEILAPLECLLVLFSTDHVFGDSSPVADASGPAHPGSSGARREDDPIGPLSVYARSKAEAEELIRGILPQRHLILRTSWVYGPDPQEKNFVYRVVRTLSQGEPLHVPADQFGQPTFGPDLARTAMRLVDRGATGTFHVIGPDYLSRLAWAKSIAETLELRIDLIAGRPTAAFPSIAPRPLHVRLSRQKLLSELGLEPFRSPRQGLEEMKEQLQI
jgi:dTDP-4-dehydrorhamnose reductase